jgi:cardiolipin synthase
VFEELLAYWPWLVLIVWLALTVAVSLHIILFKPDPPAAVGWLGMLWSMPFLGALLYYLFGINRIERRARRLRQKPRRATPPIGLTGMLPAPKVPSLPAASAHLAPLAHLGEIVTGQPLCDGNLFVPLQDGDQAFPIILKAIDEAAKSIGLSMYIFENDKTGNLFADALGRAVKRGVEVRVLVDDTGSNLGWNTILGPLTAAGVTTARFLPNWVLRNFAYANLRNHRKLIIIDGAIAFTGGMNISDDYWPAMKSPSPIHDMQFRVEGPVVKSLQDCFVEDWRFAAGENLHGERWFPSWNREARAWRAASAQARMRTSKRFASSC